MAYVRPQGKMNPKVREFSDKHPRLYGAVAFLIGVGLADWAANVACRSVHGIGLSAVIVAFSLMATVVGLGYLVFGGRCNDLDDRFIAWLNPSRVTWKPTLVLLSVVGLCIFFSVWIAVRFHGR